VSRKYIKEMIERKIMFSLPIISIKEKIIGFGAVTHASNPLPGKYEIKRIVF
jgi:hypothetical protein